MCVSGTMTFTYRRTTQVVFFFQLRNSERTKILPKVLLTGANDFQDLYRRDNLPL